MNLAVNARDAMPDGGTLTIETRNVDRSTGRRRRSRSQAAPGAYVCSSVRDTGVGMDAETQARIFEPFFTTKAPGRGTGLGLATVYGIVKQSGGFIDVESEPGQGTTFRIFLPAVADAAVDDVPRRAAAAPARGRAAPSILLIEDDAALRRLLARSLERAGTASATPPTATRRSPSLAADPAIDLLVTDAVLPGQSGPKLARQIEARSAVAPRAVHLGLLRRRHPAPRAS